jgi:hypothetical protein
LVHRRVSEEKEKKPNLWFLVKAIILIFQTMF